MKFKKKPIIVEAMQYTGNNDQFLRAWCNSIICDGVMYYDSGSLGTQLKIRTLEGDMLCGVGDWIIRGVRGEFYPCKDDIFRATYDLVDDTSDQTV